MENRQSVFLLQGGYTLKRSLGGMFALFSCFEKKQSTSHFLTNFRNMTVLPEVKPNSLTVGTTSIAFPLITMGAL